MTDGLDSRQVFARIARRYDLLNTVLSMGREQSWRRRGAAFLPPGPVLDLGAGTGTAAPVLAPRRVVALDPVTEMLTLNPMAERVVGVGEQLPFAAGSFEGVFSAYVFRNLTSIEATLAEIHRVLRPGGVCVVVDLGRPRRAALARLHRAGTAVVLPLAGATIGAREEYRYLHHSLDRLPRPEVLFEGAPLRLDRVWRMGPLGFVYAAVLRKG